MDAEIAEIMIQDEEERMGDEQNSLSWRIENYENIVHINNEYNVNHPQTHEFLDRLIVELLCPTVQRFWKCK